MKLLQKFNKKYLIFIGWAVLCLVLYFYDLANKTKFVPARSMKITYLIGACIIILILFLLLRIINKYKDQKLHIIYLIIVSTLGFIYLFLSPFLTGSDEYLHFLRIYEISEGTLITPASNSVTGSNLPKSLEKTFLKDTTQIKYQDVLEMLKISLDKSDKKLYANIYPSASLYIPIQYTPQVIGVSLGKLFNFGPYLLGFLGRLFNLIFYIVLTTIAIKILPKGKLFAMTILLSPTIFNTATTLSCDALTNSMIILYLAYVLNIIMSKEKLERKHYLILSVLALLISLFKIVYLPLIGLLLLIPKEKFESRKNKYIYLSLVYFLCIGISLWWLSQTSAYFANFYTASFAQKEYILNHPIQYIFIMIRTFGNEFVYIYENIFAGKEMYGSQLIMYEIIPIMFIGINLLTLFKNKKSEDNVFSKWQKIFIILIVLGIIVLMNTALYLQCTAQNIAIGYELIGGLQGRYFIPIILCGVLLFNSKDIEKNNINILSMLIMVTLPVFLTMIVRFMF